MNTISTRQHPISIVTEAGEAGEMSETRVPPLSTSHPTSDLAHTECMDPVVMTEEADLFMRLPDPPGNIGK
ncbi:hypothetical protein HYW11_01360 [Candidatus Peregrinibacteria bacterium]|nr:hypothetical protein [Candidatus Peregrinibacteria bacterium]